tara:strand:- start:268 stop:1011 length:744 start_codon:yes stop_codon:yes gene_type:complete
MASSINSNNIDGTYPIAGQDNDSQGFRDNFTNVKTNFTNAKAEIEDLQSKVVLKSALSGTSLDNSGGGALLSDFQVKDMSETRLAKGTTSGTVTLNYAEGSYQTVTTSGSISIAFSNFSASGTLSKVRLEVTIASVAHTVTLPSSVTLGADSLAGIVPSTKVITFDATGTYILEFSTDDAGTTVAVNDLSRNRTQQDIRSITTSNDHGQSGDVAGMMVVDSTNIYVCTGTYDGSTVIWKKVALATIT